MEHVGRRGYGFLIALMMVGSLAAPSMAAASATADRANALMPNGCSSPADCSHKVHTGDATLRGVYQANNITAISINQAVPGTVTKSGSVIVNGKTVATHAMSFGRTNLPGSTPVPGVPHAFKRPTSVSFKSSQLSAFVHMTNGRFDFAVLESCGNLVIATPATPAPAPTHAKAVAPTPAPVINVVQFQTQTQTQSQTAPAAAPTTVQPQAAPAAAPQPVAAAAALPQTGAGTIGLGGLSVLLVFAAYYWRSRRGLRLALRRG